MFSKIRANESKEKSNQVAISEGESKEFAQPPPHPAAMLNMNGPNAAPMGSIVSKDLRISGKSIRLRTEGDIQIDGVIDGDIDAKRLTIGQAARIKGNITADEIVVQGKVTGRVMGNKVRLSSTAKVEGDIIHDMIAIENGAVRILKVLCSVMRVI